MINVSYDQVLTPPQPGLVTSPRILHPAIFTIDACFLSGFLSAATSQNCLQLVDKMMNGQQNNPGHCGVMCESGLRWARPYSGQLSKQENKPAVLQFFFSTLGK